MIYLRICGRIGNQLFMYATAKAVQKLTGDTEGIIIDDTVNDYMKYENSLVNYPLDDVTFVHDLKLYHTPKFLPQCSILRFLREKEKDMSLMEINDYELKHQKLFNKFGLFHLQDGYVEYPDKFKKNIVLDGFFQSEKFFEIVKDEIIELYSLKEEVDKSNYPGLEEIRSRNTVCISAKVQHNTDNPMYDVCNDGYYEKAIQKIIEEVENPLFFVCSDNVEYVKEHLIDTTKYDVICQDTSFPVHISLAVMAQCKHFIIGNTTFGWWAQYLCTNPEKIVMAPSRWYGTPVPCDIYQDNWTLIEV